MKADHRYDSLFAYYWVAWQVAWRSVPEGESPNAWRRAKAVALVESSLYPRALSSAGAQGLMQLTVSAVEDLGLSITPRGTPPVDLFNPETNIQLGIRYLLERCWQPTIQEAADPATQWALAHAAYNAGPTRVRTVWRERDRPSLEDGPRWAGFLAGLPDETRVYLGRIQYALDRVL